VLELHQGVVLASPSLVENLPWVLQEMAPRGPTMTEVALNAVGVGVVSLAVGFGVGVYRGGRDAGASTEQPAREQSAAEPAADDEPAHRERETATAGRAGSTGGRPATDTDGASVDQQPTGQGTGGAAATATTGTGNADRVDGERRVPDHIPRAPDLEVDYDALADQEPIGGGGNADVERATLATPDGDVDLAMKTPRLSGTLHADAVERLLAEAETWDKLDDHDHVVGVVDYGSEPVPWIAMEYMDAGHLGARAGDLPTAQALWTAIAITKGVRHAHRRGVAHLDLKPANVLFRSVEGAWDVPKVADWGLSKHLLEHSASVEGLSPQYAAPEQFDDAHGPADDVTDVYQLGALFYELFTGRPPFEGSATEVMRAVLDEQPTPPSDLADVPPGLDDVLLTALATDKDDRYDSVLYVRDALAELYDER
jgi:serine/threonine protein kinase